MDAFSEVLSGVRLKGPMCFSAEFSGPVGTLDARSLEACVDAGTRRAALVIYHFVVYGLARARLEGGPDVVLSPGDIVVFPHGDPHHLSGGSGVNRG